LESGFLTEAERVLWRVTSVVCTILPLPFFLIIRVAGEFMDGIYATNFSMFLYSICRVYLIVEPIIGLRSLPAAAYQSVAWSNFLPHI
jgi:hypothetical protein